MPQRLSRRFFARPTLTVARELLGCFLCRSFDREVLRVRIVETEAYTDDLASHAKRLKRTRRNVVMFGEPGHAYVYFTYGMHHCFNIVTEKKGVPGAVLIRGVDGIAGGNGPARLCRLLEIDLALNGIDLTTDQHLWVERGKVDRQERIVQTPRIGIREGTDLPWRFYVAGSPGVSRP